jgi:hypothetical protein
LANSWQRSIDTCVLSRCLVLTHTNGREPPVRCVAVSPICGGNLRIASRFLRRETLGGNLQERRACAANLPLQTLKLENEIALSYWCERDRSIALSFLRSRNAAVPPTIVPIIVNGSGTAVGATVLNARLPINRWAAVVG